jgi:LPS-assembly protein
MRFRLATLATLAIAAPAAAQTDARALQREADRTTIEADVLDAVSDLEFSARGNAEIRRDDITIFGESLRYNRELGRTEGDGGVRLQRGADRFSGPRLYYNTLDDSGVFENPTYILERDRTARGSAERIEFLGRERYRLINANYTTCRPGHEDWRLEASELELDFEEEEGHARAPRLRFFDTTIVASPWAVFPLGDRRRSGVLTPYYAQTSSRGLEFGIPYYWNIAPEYDATFTPVYMRKRGGQLKSQFRYLNEQPFNGEMRFEYLPDDRLAGESREGVSWQHTHNLWRNTVAQLDYNKVSDDRYFVDLSSQVKQVSVGNLPQDGNVTHSGAWGRAAYSMQARVQKFQTLQDPLAPIVPPYHRAPQVNLGASYNDIAGLVDSALPIEYVRFTHPTLVEGARSSTNPTLAAPFLAPGWFVTPKAGLRAVGYSLTNNLAPGQTQSPNVSIPWASLDSGLVFERETTSFGTGSTQTLEPRLFYVYVPYRNQDANPIFDTALADYNYAQLFTENRFVGGDRFGDANQLTAALSSRILLPSGQEAARATIAQRYYFEDERVGLTPTSPLRTQHDSDILAAVGIRPNRNWTFDVATQYNRREGQLERFNTAVSYRPEPAKVLNVSYRFDRNQIRQIDISTQWPMTPGWYAVGRYNYSFLDKVLLDGLAGFEYNAGCWVFRAVVQRIQAAAQTASTAFIFQIEFNGIGSIGTDEAVELLKRNVPGYSVTNPADARLTPPTARQPLPFTQVY